MKKLKKISVIGMGLLGSSVTLSAKRELPGTVVFGYSHRESTRQKARQYEVANEITETLEQAVADMDLVILATPIQTFKDYFKEIAPFLKSGCIVTDVGSTKRLPHQWAAKNLSKDVFYVGSHPIAGSEKRGLEYARDDLLAGAKCILTKIAGTNTDCVEVLDKFWSKLGCRVSLMSPQTHDRIFGMVSHLPHMTAAALVNANQWQDIQYAGRGFIDTTRVASGPSNVWSDILQTNSQNCAKGIEKLIDQLEQLLDAVKRQDAQKIEKLLDKARDKRSKLIQYKIDNQELF